MFRALILHACAASMGIVGTAAGAITVSDALVCPGILVRAQIRSIEKTPAASVNLQIMEVYAGPSHVKGRTLVLKTNFDGQKTQGWPALRSPPSLGEDGIFILRLEKDTLVFDQAHATIGVVQLPLLKDDPGGEYEAVAAWADKVREIAALAPVLRFDAVRKALMDQSPEISAWAADAFGQASVKEAPQALDELVAESQLPLTAQVVLDKYLCEARAKIWLDTPVRIKMMEGWAASTRHASEKLQRMVVHRLTQAAASGQNPGRLTLSLVQKAIANTAMPATVKQSYLHILTRSRAELAASKEAFEFLCGVIEDAGSDELALSAAVALKDVCVLDGPRRTALEGVRRKVQNPKVGEMLDQAIRAAGR